MTNRPKLPTTKLGQWGLLSFGVALIFVVLSMFLAFVATVTGDNSLYNVLGFIGPVFVVFTTLGLVLSWLAILWKKDRVLLLVIVTIIVSAAAAITIVGEIIEGVIVTQNL